MFHLSIDTAGEYADNGRVEDHEVNETNLLRQETTDDEEERPDYGRSVSDEFRMTWTNSFRRRTKTFRKLLRNILAHLPTTLYSFFSKTTLHCYHIEFSFQLDLESIGSSLGIE